MSQSIEQRLVELAIAYTQHRKAMRDNAQAIRDQHHEVEDYIDLKPYRARYLNGEVQDLIQGECIVWHGWLHAVETCQAWDDVQWPEDEDCAFRCMAILLDKRKDIKTDGAKIRTALENLNEKVEGVVTTYDKPFTAKDHNAISRNMVVFGKVQDGKIVYAKDEDAKNAGVVRVKEKSSN